MKKVNKTQAARISEILTYAELLKDRFVTTYDGTTWPYIVDIQSISVSPSGQFVTIEGAGYPGGLYQFAQYIAKERYNVNDQEQARDLNHTLSVILKAYKKAA
jgi:hypothetical protein